MMRIEPSMESYRESNDFSEMLFPILILDIFQMQWHVFSLENNKTIARAMVVSLS